MFKKTEIVNTWRTQTVCWFDWSI